MCKLWFALLLLFLVSCSNVNPQSSTTTPEHSTIIDSKTDSNTNIPSHSVDEFEGYYEIADGLYVNCLPGIYNEPIEVEFKFANSKANLYYTRNFTYPYSSKNNRYTEPIKVFELPIPNKSFYPLTTSVDAVLSWDNGGKCVSYNYIENIQRNGTYSLLPKQNVITIRYLDGLGNELVRTLTYLYGDFTIPVVSLSMPYDSWFGDTGIYNNIRDEYEERAYFEYFDPEYKEYFYINTQVKLGGNWSLGYPQRTLNLNFSKDENGEKQSPVKAHIFKERTLLGDNTQSLTKFKRIRLHNSGNCFEQWTGFNDAILQNMMNNTDVSTTGYRPCITYLNGEYWGIYYLREHYKDYYFSSHYGVEKDTVALYDYKGDFIFNDGDEAEPYSFFKEMNVYKNYNFANDAVYQNFVNKYVDEDSLIDVIIAHSYAGNWDFVGNNNNLKAWRTTVVDKSNPYADGRLRFCLHDVDFAFTDYTNYLDKNHGNSYNKFWIFRKLMENENFRSKLYNRAEELLSTNLSYSNGMTILSDMVNEIKDYKMDANARWGNLTSYDSWMGEIKSTLEFMYNKEINYLDQLLATIKTY